MAVLSQLSQIPLAVFLKEFKHLVQTEGLNMVNRLENQQFLADLGLTKENRKDLILSLTIQDYCSGPEADKDQPGEIWVFGKEVGSQEVYIKLKIAEIGSMKIAKCISFHAARHPLNYPNK